MTRARAFAADAAALIEVLKKSLWAGKKDRFQAASEGSMKLYQKVMKYVTDRIDRGEWPVGAQIPTEKELMEILGASRMTVHRALRELAAMGRVTRRSGSGSFVAPVQSYPASFEIRSITADIAARGGVHRAEVLKQETMPANAEIAAELGIPLREPYFHVEILHLEDGHPIQIEDRIVNAQITPDFLEHDYTVTTPVNVLLSKSRPTRIEHDIQAIAANRHQARLLKMEIADPVLLIKRKTWRLDQISTRALFFHPGHLYMLGSSSVLNPGTNAPN